MSLHINKDRTNIIDLIQNIDDILPDTTVNDLSEIVNKVYKCTLGSELINIKPFVMKVDYSESM